VRGLPKLVATDLDGTLVRDDGTVSDYTRTVLDKVREAGVTLVGVTGRGPRILPLCRADLDAAQYLVLAQGGYVVDLTDESVMVMGETWVEGAVIAEAVRLLEQECGPLLVMVEADAAPGAPLWGEPGYRWPYPEPCVERPREEALKGPVLKAFISSTTLTPYELLIVARRVIPESLCVVTYAGLHGIELCPPGVNKATGLAVVTESLGVDPADVLVFGDMPNDVPMFTWAGHSVAVANAHPELRAVADEVTLSNNEDGVAVYLDRILATQQR